MATKKRRGFTLIELLVVLAIVALLSSIALPRYFASVEKAKEMTLRENLRTLRITLDRFRADKGHWPKALDEIVTQKYITKIPVDPITEQSNTWRTVAPENADEDGIADVKSGAAGTTKDGQAYDTL